MNEKEALEKGYVRYEVTTLYHSWEKKECLKATQALREKGFYACAIIHYGSWQDGAQRGSKERRSKTYRIYFKTKLPKTSLLST